MRVYLLFLSFICTGINQSLAQRQPKEKYKLVWADEFNEDGAPNKANWSFENGFVRNHELQWYSDKNAICRGGHLIIEARRDTSLNPGYKAGSKDWRQSRKRLEFTSASLKTEGLRAWKYGRFEMKARFDDDLGLWPAFWTLGTAGEWPSCGEIDIMEYYQGKILANIACGTSERYKAKWFSNQKRQEALGKNWTGKFHIWRMDWDEQAISLYVDNILLNRVELNKLENVTLQPVNPFKQPHYILLNLAIGGDNGGDPKGTIFPKKYEIDYVRVYQKSYTN